MNVEEAAKRTVVDNPKGREYGIESAGIEVQVVCREASCDLTAILLWNGRAWRVGPDDVLDLIAETWVGRKFDQEALRDRTQVRIWNRTDARLHALTLRRP
ncbi:MAG: hypothetical protein ACHREM_05665 [Polyangiales bacterium]